MNSRGQEGSWVQVVSPEVKLFWGVQDGVLAMACAGIERGKLMMAVDSCSTKGERHVRCP